jgi:acid phosphatase
MQAEKAKIVPMPAEDVGVKHVLLVVLENGDPDEAELADRKFLPFVASTGAVLDHYFAVAHPSQPNYIAIISGSIDDIPRGDDPVTIDRDHLGAALGDRWKAGQAPSGACRPRENPRVEDAVA